jgi:hypothetical protein
MSGLLDRDRAARPALREKRNPVLAAVRQRGGETGIWVTSARSPGGESADGRLVHRGFLIDAAGLSPSPLRQDPPVRRRSANRRELARVRRLRAGAQPAVADTPAGKARLTVCYDLRFPDLSAR